MSTIELHDYNPTSKSGSKGIFLSVGPERRRKVYRITSKTGRALFLKYASRWNTMQVHNYHHLGVGLRITKNLKCSYLGKVISTRKAFKLIANS
jgi:hypothetical protein